MGGEWVRKRNTKLSLPKCNPHVHVVHHGCGDRDLAMEVLARISGVEEMPFGTQMDTDRDKE